jgi:hypothetical protein
MSNNTTFDAEQESLSVGGSTKSSCSIIPSVGDGSNMMNQAKKGIARKESQAVNRVRFMVLTVLILAGFLVCFLVYFLSNKSVKDQMMIQFQGQAGQIQMSFQRIATEKLGAFGSIRVAAMAEAIDKNDTWPKFTMSSFEQRAAVARRLSQCMLIGIYPWIDTNTTRNDFEAYAAQVGPTMVYVYVMCLVFVRLSIPILVAMLLMRAFWCMAVSVPVCVSMYVRVNALGCVNA